MASALFNPAGGAGRFAEARLKVVTSNHRAALNELRGYRKDAAKLLRREVKLMVKEVSKFTPPFSSATSQESFAAQRKVGENATARDITKVFRPLAPKNPERFGNHYKPLRIFQNPDKNMQALLKSRKPQAIENFLSKIGIKAQVFKKVNPHMHENMRDRRGRVNRKKYLANYILQESSWNGYVRKKLKQVGSAKSGWAAAARGAGVSLSNWITRHKGQGEWKDETGNHRMFQRIIFGNKVPWIQATGAALRIMERAFRNRGRNIRREMEELLSARARKANQKSEMESKMRAWEVVQSHYRHTTYGSI